MKKRIILFFLFNLLIAFAFRVNAQQELGQIVISAGVGYSPEFDGAVYFGYPVSTKHNVDWNADNYPYASFSCPTYTMNVGGSIDFGLSNLFSIGIAGSYQDETMLWTLTDNQYPGPPYSYPCSDQISRTNLALRFLYHVPSHNKVVDFYLGVRPGISIWHDIPSQNNTVYTYTGPNGPPPVPETFISSPTMNVFSLQFLFGAQICINNLVGVHFNAGIGSPYLAECGLTLRINPNQDFGTPAN